MARATKQKTLIDPARNILEVVTTMLDQLRRSDRKVANLVLANPGFVLNATLSKGAARAEVSDATVIRFCDAIGCARFQAFKLRLAQSVALVTPATHSFLSSNDSTSV